MRGLARLLLLLLTACEPATQAVITVEVEPALLPRLARVEVIPYDVAWQERDSATSFALGGERALQPPFSFGAVADGSRELRVGVRGYGVDANQGPLLEQRISLHLRSEESQAVRLLLTSSCEGRVCNCELDASDPSRLRCTDGGCASGQACASSKRALGEACSRDDECTQGFCSDQVCCNERCGGDCRACDSAGSCVDAIPKNSPDHCGGCGMACGLAHVKEAHCTDVVCDGLCELGWGDCDREQRINGCETELATSAKYCGGCNRPACPYGVCRAGSCVSELRGSAVGTTVESWSAYHLAGVPVFLERGCTVVGLGINAVLGGQQPAPDVRLGLYSPSRALPQDWPGELFVDAPELSLAEGAALSAESPGLYGGVERRVNPREIEEDGNYWLFFVANGPVQLRSLESSNYWVSSPVDVDYEGLEAMPRTAEALFPLQPTTRASGALYAVVVCPP